MGSSSWTKNLHFVTFVYLVLFCYKAITIKETKDKVVLPPCAACRVLVESFNKGIVRTSREKFDGGDTAWEEDKLGSYKISEVRLIEIQEKLCTDLTQGQMQCHSLAEELEHFVEEWWFKKQDSDPDLHQYLCIETAKRCCPIDHYGPECHECPGYPDNICSKNGKCKGAGTRKGNGQCACDEGYSGALCFDCDSGFYSSYRDDKKLLCSACHKACKGNCTGGGPSDCNECQSGWKMVDSQGCIDINECLIKNICTKNTFCVNSEGNYSCLACDKACDGCTGDGPDMCIKCAIGNHREGKVCVDSDLLGRKKHENIARYGTYLGLAVATCIILQKNIYAAAVIGLLVASYISVSEYMIANSNIQDTIPKINLLDRPLKS